MKKFDKEYSTQYKKEVEFLKSGVVKIIASYENDIKGEMK